MITIILLMHMHAVIAIHNLLLISLPPSLLLPYTCIIVINNTSIVITHIHVHTAGDDVLENVLSYIENAAILKDMAKGMSSSKTYSDNCYRWFILHRIHACKKALDFLMLSFMQISQLTSTFCRMFLVMCKMLWLLQNLNKKWNDFRCQYRSK